MNDFVSGPNESKRWFSDFHRMFPLPDRYISFDLETTGFSFSSDIIVQLGFVIFEDGQLTHQASIYLNWPDSGLVSRVLLREKLDYVRSKIERYEDGSPTGRRFVATYEKLASEGFPPDAAIKRFLELLEAYRDLGFRFVTHGGIRFDCRMITEAARAFNSPFCFGPNDTFDTGLMEKASLTGIRPVQGESLYDFQDRVARKRCQKGLKFSLIEHCLPKYGIAVADDSLHEALQDSLATHLLFETFRGLVAAPPVSDAHEVIRENQLPPQPGPVPRVRVRDQADLVRPRSADGPGP